MKKTIYLAGGCFWGVEKYVSSIKGVLDTSVGFANGNTDAPSYEDVKYRGTGHAETVKVVYDDSILPLRVLLKLFFRIIDPVAIDRQGGDIGHQYRTGIYYVDERDGGTARQCLEELAKSYSEKLNVECCPLSSFWTAEEYHQRYLDKNPDGYCHVPLDMIEWVKGIDPLACSENC